MVSSCILSNSPPRFILLFSAANDAVEYCNISRSLPHNCHKDFLCEASRLPHFLDSRLTDSDDVVSLMRRSPFVPRMIPGVHVFHRLSRRQGYSAA
jgi:hypothetical protein